MVDTLTISFFGSSFFFMDRVMGVAWNGLLLVVLVLVLVLDNGISVCQSSSMSGRSLLLENRAAVRGVLTLLLLSVQHGVVNAPVGWDSVAKMKNKTATIIVSRIIYSNCIAMNGASILVLSFLGVATEV